ncbi:uncharacterized protein LOC131957990 [Physella acuta]|uniref:uncharacterized protein LOC131957990 n=1 Tax=Physella acuta TaxID=109671 RepID=UPI0027DC80BE|nr:uncharacterized protein LOC131957990 [Physella acuta]
MATWLDTGIRFGFVFNIFLLVWLTPNWSSAERCVYQTLNQTARTVKCEQAIPLLVIGIWQLDKAETKRINNWTDDSAQLIRKIQNGIGNCVIFRMVSHEEENCCAGWTGDNCDVVTCSPACAHGKCTGPDTCTCDTGWTASACDEEKKVINSSLRYCYPKKGCHGNKLFNGTAVSKDVCCLGELASWGISGKEGSCVTCHVVIL